ncbi:MAG: MFS transporter [Clostridia bacterium]|nr:MFS transporter [Clostridia bacterium]
MKNKNGQLSKRVWAGILLFMFMGSLAWNVENMYFNTFLNDMVFDQGSMGSSLTLTDAVNIMVTLSAITAAVTTFIMGTLSEKMKNRKVFISFGYIAWGIVTAIFGLITKENVASLFGLTDNAKIVTVTAWIVIVMDMIMTFMGSTSNDSAFNAWVTDVTTPESTPKVETAFTFMGFIAMGVIMVVGSLAQGGVISYSSFFIGLGVFVTIVGVIGIFLLDNPQKFENAKKEEKNTSYWADLFYGFRPSVVKENSNLYLILSSGCLFNCAFQVFFPYLFIYLGSVVIPANEGVNFLSAGVIIPAVIAIVAMVVGIIFFMNLAGKNKPLAFIICVLLLVAGLLIMSTTKNIVGVIVGVAPTLIGYIVITTQFAANVRDNIPQDKVGLFQGIRMIFLVLIPMVVGPTLGNIAAKNSDVTYMENGAEKVLPTEVMFLYAAVVAALIFIPMLAFLKKDKERVLKEKNN